MVAITSLARSERVQLSPRSPARQEPDHDSTVNGEEPPRLDESAGRIGKEAQRKRHEHGPETSADKRGGLARHRQLPGRCAGAPA